MPRKTEGEKTIERLIEEGWKISHEATVRGYKFAGAVSPKRPHNGSEFCRVRHGRCVGQHSYQITTVMMRPI